MKRSLRKWREALRAAPISTASLVALGVLALWLLRLHGGWSGLSLPENPRLGFAAAIVVVYAGFCAAVARVQRRRRHADVAHGELLVAYASQTGFAEQLARHAADRLRSSGVSTRLLALGELDAVTLARTPRALFLVSTTGEGDAPDGAAKFVRRILETRPDLSGLRYGLLALGDREYSRYCAFGRLLDGWLHDRGAGRLFESIEVDGYDEAALRRWQRAWSALGGVDARDDWHAPAFVRCRLVERRLLNPGSAGDPCFHVSLQALDGSLAWSAGDIAEVAVRNAPVAVARFLAEAAVDGDIVVDAGEGDESLASALGRHRLPPEGAPRSAAEVVAALQPLRHRDYSIASIPEDGALHLLIRQGRRPDGSLGVGAGWLTEHAAVGSDIELRVRPNSGFHAPDGDTPMILVGNGTGMAGLRALLKSRVAAGRRRNWLLFGERNAAVDFFYRDDIEAWRARRFIERLDLAFSRDRDERVYVQQRLREAAADVRRWVGDGAAIYVCGSLEGMAPGVDAALAEILGTDGLQRLIERNGYRRDVY